MKEILLTQNKITQCDDDDYENLMLYKWSYSVNGYPMGYRKGEHIVMHLLIHRINNLNIPEGFEVDHKDGDKLNNQKDNYRIVTKQQNRMNSKKAENCRSEYKGVSFCRGKNVNSDKGKWMARIQDPITKKRIWLGNFETEIEAARAYDKAANKLFGEYSRYNFPEDYKTPNSLKV